MWSVLHVVHARPGYNSPQVIVTIIRSIVDAAVESGELLRILNGERGIDLDSAGVAVTKSRRSYWATAHMFLGLSQPRGTDLTEPARIACKHARLELN